MTTHLHPLAWLFAVALMMTPIYPHTPAQAGECSFPSVADIDLREGASTMHENECGEPYEVGYRLEGNTLHFPRGGSHTIRNRDEEAAEALLRETYGLIGDRDALIRTRW